jgi:hypothetical protein
LYVLWSSVGIKNRCQGLGIPQFCSLEISLRKGETKEEGYSKMEPPSLFEEVQNNFGG